MANSLGFVFGVKSKIEKSENQKLINDLVKYLKDGVSIETIQKEMRLDSFFMSDYLLYAFWMNDIDITKYISMEDVEKICNTIKELLETSSPTKTAIKNAAEKATGSTYSWAQMNIVFGFYSRQPYYKSKQNTVSSEKPFIVNAAVIGEECKIDIQSVPFLMDAIKSLKTERWKKFTIEFFSKVCPKQFFIMPASMHKGAHEITELTVGKFDEEHPEKLVVAGGKYFHSIRVLEFVNHQIESDAAEKKNYKGIVDTYVIGNEFKDYQCDILRVAALLHDVYSGSIEDEFNYKRKGLDKYHPYYHRYHLDNLKNIIGSEKEWELFLLCVENHMWKWSPEKELFVTKFNKIKELPEKEKDDAYSNYRMAKVIQNADYFASRRDETRSKEIMYFIRAFYLIKGNYDFTEEDKKMLGLDAKSLYDAFGHSSLDEVVEIVKKIY